MSEVTTPSTPYGVAQPPSPRKTALTLWALIVAIVAIVLAIIPGLSFVAWLPAIAATVLGIIGLVSKANGRGKALVAVILGPIALIVAIVVSVATFAVGLATQEIDTGSHSTVDEPIAEETDEAEAPDPNAVGTSGNPAPAGTPVTLATDTGDFYELSFGEPILNANKQVAAANQFNDKPAAGMQFILVPTTFTYTGTETGTPWLDIQLEFVSAAGTTHNAISTNAVPPKPITFLPELSPGESATGDLVLLVPTEDLEQGTLTVKTIYNELYFMSLV